VEAFQRLPRIVTSCPDRLAALRPLYTALPSCVLRARAAFAMGLEMLQDAGDADACERLLFEAVYILDQSDAAPWLVPALEGELGYQVRPATASVWLRPKTHHAGF